MEARHAQIADGDTDHLAEVILKMLITLWALALAHQFKSLQLSGSEDVEHRISRFQEAAEAHR